MPSKLERPLHLFLCLSADRPARQASPHAVLQKLCSSMEPVITDAIKAIQHIPTGLAIWPKGAQGERLLVNKKEEIQQTIQGSNTEPEQKWAILIIPGTINIYRL